MGLRARGLALPLHCLKKELQARPRNRRVLLPEGAPSGHCPLGHTSCFPASNAVLCCHLLAPPKHCRWPSCPVSLHPRTPPLPVPPESWRATFTPGPGLGAHLAGVGRDEWEPGFKMSEAIHSGADTTLAPTNVSAPPPLKSVPWVLQPTMQTPRSGPRGQTLKPCPTAAPRPAGWRPRGVWAPPWRSSLRCSLP